MSKLYHGERLIKEYIAANLTDMARELNRWYESKGLAIGHKMHTLSGSVHWFDSPLKQNAYVADAIAKAVIQEFVNFTDAFEGK